MANPCIIWESLFSNPCILFAKVTLFATTLLQHLNMPCCSYRKMKRGRMDIPKYGILSGRYILHSLAKEWPLKGLKNWVVTEWKQNISSDIRLHLLLPIWRYIRCAGSDKWLDQKHWVCLPQTGETSFVYFNIKEKNLQAIINFL